MASPEHNGHETPTLLEQVIQLHGQFRQALGPLAVTPLQAGVLLYLQRQADAPPRMKDTALAVQVSLPTMSELMRDLVRKGLVSRQRSTEDKRALYLRLTPQGQRVAVKIEHSILQVTYEHIFAESK